MDYARAFRVGRAIRDVTQKGLAKQAEINRSYLSLIEKGSRKPSTEVIENVARALGMPIYVFMMLGANKEELNNICEAVANSLARLMLDVLAASKEAPDEGR